MLFRSELSEDINYEKLNVQCRKSRTLTVNGVFNCPLLASDNRGKSGANFNDYSCRSYLETSYCTQCVKHNIKLFSFDL